MSKYINPFVPDDQIAGRVKKQIAKDKAKADSFDRQVLFSGPSTYVGSPDALRRMAARAGKRLPKTVETE